MTDWINIKGYEDLYEININGEIKSKERFVFNSNKSKRKILCKKKKKTLLPIGYYTVNLWKNNKEKIFYVHRLIAEHFIPNLNNYKQVNHKNGIKTDNSINNLEWCTCKQNVNHAINIGLSKNILGENNKSSKYSNYEIINIKKMYSSGYSKDIIIEKYGISRSYLNSILRGEWRKRDVIKKIIRQGKKSRA